MFASTARIALSFLALQAIEFLPAASAEFRVTCAPFKRERIDPLATPGQENAHMHTFWGSRAVGPDALTADKLRSQCSTCQVQADRSSYWIPTLYYVSKNATVPVKVAIFHVYYHGQNEDREPFPDDFSIISGNPNLTEDEARQQGGIGMGWHFEDSDEEKEAWQLPKKKGGGWLRGNVPFPTSVVKDESIGRYRECKSKDEEGCFNVIRMFFAIWYDLRNDWFDFADGAYLTLSSGGGQTYHGDFIYGWDPKMAEQIVRDTTNYVELGKPIGGDEGLVKSAECAKLDEEDPFLWDSDWDAMLKAKAGNGTVELGHYGRGLTITDGKSANATWSGKWGEEPGAGESVPDVEEVSSVVESSTAVGSSSVVEPSDIIIAETAAPSLASVALPTAYSDALLSLTLPPGETTGVISWIETRKASPTACAKKRKRSSHA